MNRIHRCLGAAAALGGALLTLAVAAPAALATIPDPGGGPGPGPGPQPESRCWRLALACPPAHDPRLSRQEGASGLAPTMAG